MYDLGVVDLVVEAGEGEGAVADLVRRRARRATALTAISRVRQRVAGVSHRELSDIVAIWVDTALAVPTRDLDLMRRLARRQAELHSESSSGLGEFALAG
jgi:DSF synthase